MKIENNFERAITADLTFAVSLQRPLHHDLCECVCQQWKKSGVDMTVASTIAIGDILYVILETLWP